MSAAVGAALKKVALLLLGYPKARKKVLTVVLVVLLAILLPVIGLVGIMSGGIQIDTAALQERVVTSLTPAQTEMLQGIEETAIQISQNLTEAGLPEKVREAQALYLLALFGHAAEQDFVSRLCGCFREGQTDEQLVAAINAAFGTDLAPSDYTSLMGSVRASYIDTAHFAVPESKNNYDLAAWAEAAEAAGWGYVWGTFGQVLSTSLLEAKLEQYPDNIGPYEDFIREHWLGKRTADCVGRIKGYSWYDPATGSMDYASNGMPDIDADQIYDTAVEKGPISTIPEIPGLLVWMEGHVGIYIGNGQVIEARGTRYGVVRTELDSRGWIAWAKIPYIHYLEEPPQVTEPPTTIESEDIP